MLQVYDIDDYLLMVIKLRYCQPEVCVRENSKQSKSLHLGVGLRKKSVLSPLLFIIYINSMDKLSRTHKCITIGRCKISRLFFTDDLVWLASLESGLQHALNGFATAYGIAGIKISTSETEVSHFLRNLVQCSLQVGRVSMKQVEKFKYLWVVFTSDGRQDEESAVQSGKASAVIRCLTNIITLRFKNFSTSSCYFSGLKDLTWMVWPCKQNASGTVSQANFIC